MRRPLGGVAVPHSGDVLAIPFTVRWLAILLGFRPMRRLRRWLAITSGCLILMALWCGFLAFAVGMLPLSVSLARSYFDAVTRQDIQAAVALAGSDHQCRSSLEEDANKDIAQFGATETRNVSIQAFPRGHTQHSEMAVIRFEYRKPTQSEWQQAEIRLMIDGCPLCLRYICEKYYHAP